MVTNTVEQREQLEGEVGTDEVVLEVGPEMEEDKGVALEAATEKQSIVTVVGVVDNEAEESFEIVVVFVEHSNTDEIELEEAE